MSNNDGLLIYHLFADRGVESEFLSAFGRVIRVGIDPFENSYSKVVQGDATNPPLKPGADIVVCHPPCYKWAESTRHIPDREEVYPDLIPETREVAAELGDQYIIENVPKAPLRDPVVLNGRMFNLPIHYERAFETSFPVKQPSENGEREDEVSWWNEYSRPLSWWKTTKGYRDEWEKDSLVKVAVPQTYLDYLFQFYISDQYGYEVPGREQASLGEW